MRISDWSSDVCSSDLRLAAKRTAGNQRVERRGEGGKSRLDLRQGGYPGVHLLLPRLKQGVRTGALCSDKVRHKLRGVDARSAAQGCQDRHCWNRPLPWAAGPPTASRFNTAGFTVRLITETVTAPARFHRSARLPAHRSPVASAGRSPR